MNKTEFIKELSKKTKFTQKDCGVCLNEMVNLLQTTLSKGDSVNFIGFGKFEVKYRKERLTYNPITKNNIMLPASNTPVFKAGKNLREAVL